jgi:hypothetical protein
MLYGGNNPLVAKCTVAAVSTKFEQSVWIALHIMQGCDDLAIRMLESGGGLVPTLM